MEMLPHWHAGHCISDGEPNVRIALQLDFAQQTAGRDLNADYQVVPVSLWYLFIGQRWESTRYLSRIDDCSGGATVR